MNYKIPDPELQVAFSRALAHLRSAMLQDALRDTMRNLDIALVDRELAEIVSPHSLAMLAGHGMRGELLFPVPMVLNANPKLMGYYRLLYGYSQKEFFKPNIGSRFKSAETTGKISTSTRFDLLTFCKAMAEAGSFLLAGISSGEVSPRLLDDLTLLTLGPQLRGGANVAIGAAAIVTVFGVIREIVDTSVEMADQNRLQIRNAAGRVVSIEFAPDPDIIIRESLPSGNYRHIIAIEVKGGKDFSNVHNRIGEAEKSHQKARHNGYTECWTVINVDNIDFKTAKRESPSTDRFYLLSNLISGIGQDFNDFRDRVISLTGIPNS